MRMANTKRPFLEYNGHTSMVILTYKVREKHAFSKNLEDHPPTHHTFITVISFCNSYDSEKLIVSLVAHY